jgi:repressor of nif and glnA expression
MEHTIDNPLLYNILKILANSEIPLGAKSITEKLEERGITAKKETVQHYLRVLDEMGLTKKIGIAGRVISEKGIEELRKGMLKERLGYFIELRENYIYQSEFDPETKKGLISLNLGIINESKLDKALKFIKDCVDAGLAMSPLIKIYDGVAEVSKVGIPEGKVGIGLVSTSVVDAALTTNRIYPTPTFAGVLQYMNREPVRFIQAISYTGSTLDPIDLFIKSGFCSVGSVVKRGHGTIPADIREIPAVLRKRAVGVIEKLNDAKIMGVIHVGEASRSALGVPVGNRRVGVVVIAGSTPLAYLKEKKLKVEIRILSAFERYDDLEDIGEFV